MPAISDFILTLTYSHIIALALGYKQKVGCL